MLVGRKGADVSAPTLSALKGRKIAIVSGYSYGNEIEGTGPVFTRSQSEEDSLRRVLDASVEYALMDELVVAYIIERYPKEAQQRLQVGATSLVMRPLHFIVRRNRPDAQSIIDQFNAQLKAMIVDRTYHRLLQVHWIRADVDGDGIAEYRARQRSSGQHATENRVLALFQHHPDHELGGILAAVLSRRKRLQQLGGRA